MRTQRAVVAIGSFIYHALSPTQWKIESCRNPMLPIVLPDGVFHHRSVRMPAIRPTSGSRVLLIFRVQVSSREVVDDRAP